MSRSRISSTEVAACTRWVSSSSSPVSAKKVMTVWLRGSCPFVTFSRTTSVGNCSRISPNFASRVPRDGSEPRYVASSGVISSTLNAPTKKNVKSAALAKRCL